MKNYYEILGVSQNSETEVITAAYKAMMRKYHPDTNDSAQAAERAKEINEAYEVLKNPLRRREYDAKMGRSEAGSSSPPPPPPRPPASDQSPPSEPNRAATSVLGKHGELRAWVIFAAGYVAIALLYVGPKWILAYGQNSPLVTIAEIAGITVLPFGLGFIIAWLWKTLAPSELEPKSHRVRWLVIQFFFIALLVFNRTMLERAKYEEAAATVRSDQKYQEDKEYSEMANKCYEAVEAKDWKESWSSCAVAAENGDAGSQNNIGLMYNNGFGVAKNPSEAVRWFRKSAEQGAIYAQYNLALAYDYGDGVDQNYDQAIAWYQKAADQGDEEALSRIRYLKGQRINSKKISQIPNVFHGEWNEDLTACGTDHNDSKLVVSETLLSFWESDAYVKSVKINDPYSVTVSAKYKGEGQTWSKTITLNISRSESELTIEGFTRYRCS